MQHCDSHLWTYFRMNIVFKLNFPWHKNQKRDTHGDTHALFLGTFSSENLYFLSSFEIYVNLFKKPSSVVVM